MSGPQPRSQPMADAAASIGSSSHIRGHQSSTRAPHHRGESPGTVQQERPHIGELDVARFIKILLSFD